MISIVLIVVRYKLGKWRSYERRVWYENIVEGCDAESQRTRRAEENMHLWADIPTEGRRHQYMDIMWFV
jgi:hypothetical protein